MPYLHQPVLLEPLVALAPHAILQPPTAASKGQAPLLVDATLGGGGSAHALLQAFPKAQLFGCDCDPQALEAAKAQLKTDASRILLKKSRFADLASHVLPHSVHYLIADLGVSSPQLEQAKRGFSFMHNGPLDMRMDMTSTQPNAAELIATLSQQQLKNLFQTLGEENFAAPIAKAIARQRITQPFTQTLALANTIAKVLPIRARKKNKHPATQVFQALRMAVNDELGQLKRLLTISPALLAVGGRIGIITFHSLEDRMVKHAFRQWQSPCTCPPRFPVCSCNKKPLGKVLTLKPVTCSPTERALNPRARSAKLRVFEKHTYA